MLEGASSSLSSLQPTECTIGAWISRTGCWGRLKRNYMVDSKGILLLVVPTPVFEAVRILPLLGSLFVVPGFRV